MPGQVRLAAEFGTPKGPQQATRLLSVAGCYVKLHLKLALLLLLLSKLAQNCKSQDTSCH